MEVLDRQQIGLTGLKPSCALVAMPIAATIVGDLGMSALTTALDMATNSGCAAGLDRCHHAQLTTIEVTGIGAAVGLAVAAEDIRHFELWARHLSRVSAKVCGRVESATSAL
jgi:hypothetical protein